ncbi:MAG: hypothetical protein ACW98K_05440 [Candidatus Kariarchaeaceae archaeon]
MKNSIQPLTLMLAVIILSCTSPLTAKEDLPDTMVYEYDDYSYWVGYSHLVADIRNNGEIAIDYSVSKNSEFPDSSIGPFDSSFEATYLDVFEDWNDLFASTINATNMKNWNTSRYQSTPAMCDGGGINQILSLNWTSEIVVVEHIVDNDSCSGTRTNKSSSDILIQLDHVHDFIINLVNERGTPTSPSNGLTVPFVNQKTGFVIPLSLIGLVVQKKIKKWRSNY